MKLSKTQIDELAKQLSDKFKAMKKSVPELIEDMKISLRNLTGRGTILIDDFINGLVDANKYIKEGKFIEGVKKIDLMGGKTSQLGNEYVNVDIQATKGINGSVSDLDKFIKPNSIDEIVCNNPYNPSIKDPYELFIKKSKEILQKDGLLTINGQPQNGFIKKITIEKLQQLGFEVIEFKVPLKDKYKNLIFGTTGGNNSIDPETMISIILKKK